VRAWTIGARRDDAVMSACCPILANLSEIPGPNGFPGSPGARQRELRRKFAVLFIDTAQCLSDARPRQTSRSRAAGIFGLAGDPLPDTLAPVAASRGPTFPLRLFVAGRCANLNRGAVTQASHDRSDLKCHPTLAKVSSRVIVFLRIAQTAAARPVWGCREERLCCFQSPNGC